MKYTFFLFFIVGILLSSCSNKGNELLMKQLDDIQLKGDTLPSEAMLCLNSIKPLFKDEPEYARNKMALLDIRLRDKAFIAHNSDSTMKAVCRFFEKQGSARDKQEAYYYMGSVYRDLNDYPNAVTYFLKSIKLAEDKAVIDNALLENACSQLSHLYHMQFNYAEALDVALKGLHIAENSRIADERTYMGVASGYYKLNDTLQTIKYAESAIECIEKKGISSANADVVASAMGKFASFGYQERAALCHRLLEQLPDSSKPFNYLTNLAVYYELHISVDTAAMLRLEHYRTTSCIEDKYDATRWLVQYYYAIGDYEKASEYAIKFISANRDLIDKRDFEHTTNAKNIFRYQRDKEEELRIIEQGRKDRYYLILGISVSLILLLAAAVIYYRRKKMLLEIILNKENDIMHVKSVVRDKEQELVSLNLKNESLSEQLEHAKDEFKMLVSQNRELTKLSLMKNVPDDAKDIIEKARRTSKGKYRLDDDEWKELLGAIDRMFPEFTYEVQSKFKKISEPVLRVCYLRKIGLSAPEIVNLTDYPRQTVWDRIKRIEMIMEW